MGDSRPAAGSDQALFLDRDGVINRKRSDHVKSWEEFEFLPGVLQALRDVNLAGIRVIVVTNQSAVGRGLVQPETLVDIHGRLTTAVAAAGGNIERIYACTHTPDDGCGCRKPNVGLFTLASRRQGVRLAGSVMVGDAETDVQAAHRVGCRPVLIGDRPPVSVGEAVLLAKDLAEAVAQAKRIWTGAA